MATFREEYEEWKKKKNEGGSSSSSSSSFADEYRQWKVQNGHLDIESIGNEISERVSTWLRNNENYVSNARNRFSGKNTSYRADASDWLSTVTTQKSNFEKEAEGIKAMLEQYKSFFNEDYVNSVIQALDGNLKVQGDVISNATKDLKYWSQWETEDDYIKWDADWLYTEGENSADKVAKRQKIYQRNKKRIADPNTPKEEVEALKAENLKYERTQGVADKYYMPITDEVNEIASNRDHDNATMEDLWKYDAVVKDISARHLAYDYDGNMTDAGGNVIYDANHPVVKAMRENNLDAFYDSVIDDKLGMYLSASQDDLDEAYNRLIGGGNADDTWAILMNEGETNAWKELSSDEITIYYYKLNTEGQASAYKFLEDMTVELTRRATEKRAKEISDAPLLEQIFLNVASIPMNVFGGAVGLVGDVANAIEGKDYNPYSAAHSWSNDASAIREDTAKDINNATGNVALPWVGTTFGDVYQSIMSVGDSAMSSFIPGGHHLLGLNAASTEMKDLYERGASTEQMLAGGILAGAAESFFEKYSIGELKKIKNMDYKSVKNFADGFVKAMVMGGVEASEEMATEIANTISDALVMGSQSDWEDFGTFVKNVVNAGIGGFISGGLMGGVASSINNASYNQKVKEHGQTILDTSGQRGVDALKQFALDVYADKGGLTGARGDRLIGKVSDNPTAKNVGKLSTLVGNTISSQNRTDIESALVEKGLSKKDAKRVSEYLTSTNELTKEQKAEIKNNENIKSVVEELIDNPNSVTSEREKNLIRARLGISPSPASKASAQQTENTSVTENASATENATEGKFEASAEGKTIVKETGKEVSIEEIVSNEGGNLMVKLDNGETVNARDLAYATAEEGLVYEMVANMGVNPNTAMVLVKAYNPASGVKAQTYAIDIPLAYQYGKIGYKKGLARLNLTDEQSATAYILGRDDVKASGRTWSDTSRKTPETNKSKAAEDGIIYDGFELNEDSLTDIQKASLAGIRTIAKMSPTLEIHMFESVVENGKKYAVVNGKKVLAPNGFFRNGNEIYIDINAGKGTMGAMLYTASHEIVHFIAENSFEDFQVLADFLFEHYGENNVPVDQLINREIDKLKKDYAAKNKELPSESDLYMKAYEEVVANAMSKMLADPTSYEKLAKLKSKNLTLWEKIGEAIKRMLDKLKSMLGIYEGRTPDQMAAHYVDDFSAEVYNKLQDLYLKAFVNAEANYQASIGSRNLEDFADAKNTEGDSLFQYKAMEADEDTYREMLKKWGKMTDSQISNLFLTIDNAMELIKDNLEALDYAWEADIDDRAFSPVKPNSDKLYQVSLDFSTLCRKRLLQQMVQTQLQEALNKPLTREEGIAIRDALIAIQEEGRQIEVACALCYVESARMKSPEQIRKFMDNKEKVIKEFFAGKSGGSMKEKLKKAETDAREKLHKENPNGIKGKDGSTMLDPRTASLKALPKKYADEIRSAKKAAKASYVPTAEEQRLIEVAKGMTVSDFTSPEGLENLAKNYRDLFDAYTSFVRNATKSKGIESDTWWRAGDSMQIGDVLIANMNKENGLRSQSWSDFQVVHILDYIAATIELATRNTKEQAYTKVPDFAELMGQTGVMINLSLIPTAKFNGKLEYDSTEGIDYKRSLELRDKYHATVGTICIGIDNVQIQMLLGDVTVDYVIPYHKSGMSAVIRKAMHIPTWTQYEEYQSEKNLSRAEAKKQADKHGVKLLAENDPNYQKHPNFSDWFDIKEAQQITKMENANPSDKAKQKKYGVMYGGYMAMQNAANNYLKLCAERGISPKFSHEKADFTTEENYWKLLIDRKMVDNVTGEVIEQQTIKPIFDEKEVMRILNDELERYPKVKEDQEYAIRKVTEAYLSGNLKGGMSAKDIAKVMQTPVDNVSNVNIFASTEGDTLYSVDDDLPKITVGMTESERATILRKTGISPKEIEAIKDEDLDWVALEQNKKSAVEKPLIEKLRNLGLLTAYKTQNVDVEFKFTGGGLRKSLNSQVEHYGGTLADLTKVVMNMQALLDSSVLIEVHKDKAKQENARLVQVFVLLSAFKENGYITPVQFEVKQFIDNENRLYLAVALTKIEESVLDDTALLDDEERTRLILPSGYSIPYFVEKINPQDGNFFKYIPDDFLNDAQKEAKRIALEKDAKKYQLQSNGDTLFSIDDDTGSVSVHKIEEMLNVGEKEIYGYKIKSIYKGEPNKHLPSFSIAKPDGSWSDHFGHWDVDINHTIAEYIAEEIAKRGLISTKKSSITSDPDSVSTRSLLANALETTAQNDIEKNKLAQYKSKIDLIEKEQAKLTELRAKIKELSSAKGARDTEAIKKLQFEANQTANRINVYDRQLLNLESTTALKNVLQREKKLAYDKAKKEGKEALAKYREKAAKTQRALMDKNTESRKKAVDRRKMSDIRTKIKNFKKKLESSLLHPTDRQYIPLNLVNAMIDVFNLIDTDTPLYKPNGELNKAQASRDLTKEKLQALKDEYEALKTNADPMYSEEFDEVIYKYLTKLQIDFKDKSLADMSLAELEEMYEILKSIGETLQEARKVIGWGDASEVYEAGNTIVAEQAEITQSRKEGKRNAAQRVSDQVIDLTLSPVRNVERMSGYREKSPLLRLFKDFERGVRKKNMFVMEANKDFEALSTGENAKQYEEAIYNAYGDKTYTDVNGRKFGISKMQMMQTILSYERETANKMHHIEGSGFTFADLDMLRKGKLKEAVSEEYSHRVPSAVAMVQAFTKELENDKWAQDYMAAARKFFDGKAKDAVNETYITLKHRIIARDKNYIPFEVDKNFVVREISAQNDIQQTINSYGMLQDTKDGASQPLIITGLNNILDRHIDQVGNVYGLAVPIRNFNKVWNVRSVESNFGGDPTVQAAIQRNWGLDGTKVITQAVQDLQGARPNTQSELYKKAKSGYIGATFALNLSVVTKQIGSLFSATSMLKWRSPIKMVSNLIYTMANHKKISAEVDKYTASVWMRRQGLSDAELHTLVTQAKKPGFFKWLNKLPTIINPTKWITSMDTMVALSLWKYAKQDTAKRTGLTGEELLKATAEFYDSVIENTQSMTDVLHRPEIQKRNDVISEAFGMFKTDLYQTAGQLQTALGRYMHNKSKENGAALARTVYSATASAVWGSLMTTLFALLRYKVKQYRDDEDDELTMESWLKRQTFGFFGDIVGYVFPLAGGEFMGLIENIMYGESEDVVDSLALTAINDLYDAFVTIGSAVKDGEMPAAEDWEKLVMKSLQIFGVPANNVKRTVKAIRLHAEDIANGEFFSFEAGKDKTKAQALYDAVMSGNDDRIGKAKEVFDSESEIKTALKQGLRENDSRIKNAVQALNSGNIRGFNGYIEAIASEGHFDKETIEGAIRAEQSAFNTKIGEAAEAKTKGDDNEYKKIVRELRDSYRGIYSQDDIIALIKKAQEEQANTETDDEVEEATSIYKASDINLALESGDTEMALEIIDNLFNTKVENALAEARRKAEKDGKRFNERTARQEAETDAKSSIKSPVTSYWKKLTIEAFANDNKTELLRIRDLLFSTGLYGKNLTEVYNTMKDWNKKS